MGIIFALSLSAGSSLVSALATRTFLGNRHDLELDEFDRRVTGEIEASLHLYGNLKTRMTSIFDALDEKEARFERRLENQRSCIKNLQDTLDGYAKDELDAETGDPLLKSFKRRERELEHMRELHAELAETSKRQAKLLEQAVKGFQPTADDLETQEQLVGTWRERLDDAESQAEESIAKLEERVGALEPQAEQLERRELELSELREELEVSRKKAKDSDDKVAEQKEALRVQAEEMGSTIGSMRSGIEETTSLIGKLELDVKEKSKAIEAGAERADKAESGLADIQAKLAEARKAFEDRVESTTEECRDLQHQVDAAEREVEVLELAAKASGDLQKELEEDGADLRVQLASAETAFEDAMSKASGFESDAREKTLACEGAEERVLAAQSELSDSRQGLEDLQAKFDAELEGAKSGEAASAAKFEEQLEEERARFQGAQEDAKVQLDKTAAELVNTRASAEQSATDLEAAQAGKDDLQQKNEALQAKLEQVESSIEEQTAERGELQSILAEVEAAKKDLEVELSNGEEKASEQGERIEMLELSLVSASGEADDQRQAVLNKMSTFHEAQKMLEAMRPMLEGLEDTLRQEDEKK